MAHSNPVPDATDRPLVTVVMPSMNQAVFLDASVASVLNQTYPNIELVVADGGSQDGSADTLARWQAQDARLRYVSEPDKGPADAVNKALRMARGTVIGWLNSDDLYTPGAVQRAVDAFHTGGPNLMMVYGQGEHIDAGGQHLHAYPTLPPSTPIRQFAQGCFICQPTVFFRRSMFVMLGGLDESLQTAFDFDYWLRASKAFADRIGFVDAIQAQSRLHQACITQTMRRQVAIEGVRVLHRHLGQAPIHWILTHMAEARQSAQPDLARYLDLLLDEARPYFSEPHNEALRRAAADTVG